MTPQLSKFSGWLLMASLLLAIASAFMEVIPSYWPGVLIWPAVILLLPHVKKSQKKQIGILLSIGAVGLLIGWFFHVDAKVYFTALEANQKVTTMLIAVGFLKLLLAQQNTEQKKPPKGRKALLFTLINTHLFGAVINMSSVIIVGDRLARKAPLKAFQGVLLLRAFGMCAFWSPFFASMGLVLLTAPGAQFNVIVLYGIPITLIGMALTIWQLMRRSDAHELHGYPVAFESLWIPCSLAVIVMLLHTWLPDLSILTLVSITSLTFTLLWLTVTQGKNGLALFKQHIEVSMADSRGEVVLFASAALLASGITALLTSLNLDLAPAHFGYVEACVTLIALVMLAMAGMHPVASATLAGSLLAPSVTDPNFLAITLLMSWALAITLSPFSGVQLSVQSRYALSPMGILKLNIHYTIGMILSCMAILWLYLFIQS